MKKCKAYECIRDDARRLQADKDFIVIGDFNGHLSELDGHLDETGRCSCSWPRT